jgi:[acyl-carrier-protein] S-malonyltransferase
MSGGFRGVAPPDQQLFGTVVTRGGERAVAAPWPAEIIEWLVEEGDPVSEGQPLVRIHPRDGA